MIRTFTLFIAIVNFTLTSAQDASLASSLEQQLELEPDDSVKVRLLNELALQYVVTDSGKVFSLIEDALALSISKSFPEGIGMTHHTWGKALSRMGYFEEAISEFEKARAQLIISGDEVKLAGTIVDEGNAYLFLSDYDHALQNYKNALNLFEQYKHTPGRIRCLNNMGIVYKNFGEYQNALYSYNEVIRLSEELGDTISIADTYINMGVVFVHLGAYHRALDYFNQALVFAEANDNLKQQSISLMNSGVIHNKLGNYTRAHQYYESALKISEKQKDRVEISRCLTNIGTNYISQDKFELARDYILKGLEIKKELGDRSSIANSYNFLAEIEYHTGNFQQAIELDYEAMGVKREVNDIEGLTRCFSNISRTYIAMENLHLANAFSDSTLKYAKVTGSLEHQASAYLVKMNIAEVSGNFESAFRLSQLYKKFSDSLLNESKLKAVNEIEMGYQADLLSVENNRLKLQSELDQEIIQRQRRINVAILGMIAMFMIMILFGVYVQRNRKKYYDSVQEKNMIITRQNMKLDSLNNTKDKILSVITHDLRGTIGNQLTALSVLGREEFHSDEERHLVFSRLANSARLSLELLENLTLWTSIQEEKIQYVPKEGLLNDVLEEVVEMFSDSFFNKEISCTTEYKNSTYCNFDSFMVKSILKNLIGNALKFTKRGGNIKAGVLGAGDKIDVYVEDNGIGMSEREIARLKNGGVSKMKRGTENEKGSGLGYYIIKHFTDHHHCGIKIDSEENRGTRVTVTFNCQ